MSTRRNFLKTAGLATLSPLIVGGRAKAEPKEPPCDEEGCDQSVDYLTVDLMFGPPTVTKTGPASFTVNFRARPRWFCSMHYKPPQCRWEDCDTINGPIDGLTWQLMRDESGRFYAVHEVDPRSLRFIAVV